VAAGLLKENPLLLLPEEAAVVTAGTGAAVVTEGLLKNPVLAGAAVVTARAVGAALATAGLLKENPLLLLLAGAAVVSAGTEAAVVTAGLLKNPLLLTGAAVETAGLLKENPLLILVGAGAVVVTVGLDRKPALLLRTVVAVVAAVVAAVVVLAEVVLNENPLPALAGAAVVLSAGVVPVPALVLNENPVPLDKNDPPPPPPKTPVAAEPAAPPKILPVPIALAVVAVDVAAFVVDVGCWAKLNSVLCFNSISGGACAVALAAAPFVVVGVPNGIPPKGAAAVAAEHEAGREAKAGPRLLAVGGAADMGKAACSCCSGDILAGEMSS
jgi:hypothetical protein